MWKALIKLVEKWAYRCEHDWELTGKYEVFTYLSKEMPGHDVFLYRCTKCCKSTQIKSNS